MEARLVPRQVRGADGPVGFALRASPVAWRPTTQARRHPGRCPRRSPPRLGASWCCGPSPGTAPRCWRAPAATRSAPTMPRTRISAAWRSSSATPTACAPTGRPPGFARWSSTRRWRCAPPGCAWSPPASRTSTSTRPAMRRPRTSAPPRSSASAIRRRPSPSSSLRRSGRWSSRPTASYLEICRITGWTYTKVNRCLTEGRQSLRERLRDIEAGRQCRRWEPVVSAAAEGRASAQELISLQLHLRGCGACRASLRAGRMARRAPAPPAARRAAASTDTRPQENP